MSGSPDPSGDARLTAGYRAIGLDCLKIALHEPILGAIFPQRAD
jgi:hypothetical protein